MYEVTVVLKDNSEHVFMTKVEYIVLQTAVKAAYTWGYQQFEKKNVKHVKTTKIS